MATPLKPKQRRFCEEYLIDLNGSAAAIRAGYSKKTSRIIAFELLTKPNILAYIQKLKEKRSERTEITADMVVAELAKIGFSNVQDYIRDGNLIQDLSKIDSKQAAAVSSIKKSITHFGSEKTEGTKEVVEFKLWDKVAALEKIGRHLGIFEKDNAQSKPEVVIKQNVIKLANGDEISI